MPGNSGNKNVRIMCKCMQANGNVHVSHWMLKLPTSRTSNLEVWCAKIGNVLVVYATEYITSDPWAKVFFRRLYYSVAMDNIMLFKKKKKTDRTRVPESIGHSVGVWLITFFFLNTRLLLYCYRYKNNITNPLETILIVCDSVYTRWRIIWCLARDTVAHWNYFKTYKGNAETFVEIYFRHCNVTLAICAFY